MAEVLSDDACLTSVAYIGPNSRTERPRKTKIGTEVDHVTRDSDTTFKVKRSKVNLQGRRHIVAASHTACLLILFSREHSRSLQVLHRPSKQESYRRLQLQDLLQAGCPSCHPTNIVRPVKEY